MEFFGSWCRVCFHFKRPCHRRACLYERSTCLRHWKLLVYAQVHLYGNCLSMLKCIYGLVQAPRQYYMLCREVYQKAGMKQLQTDECVCTRYVSNIIGSPSLTNEDLLVKGKFLTMEILPMQMRVYRSCFHPVAAMILVMYVDNNGIRYNWSWCKNLRSLSSKMVALICNVKESSFWFLSVRYTYD